MNTVAICDTEPLAIEGLQSLLAAAEGLRVVAADSSCLEVVEGDGWCAVGDAAAAYDPLSSQGITTALASGAWAGQAIAGGTTVIDSSARGA